MKFVLWKIKYLWYFCMVLDLNGFLITPCGVCMGVVYGVHAGNVSIYNQRHAPTSFVVQYYIMMSSSAGSRIHPWGIEVLMDENIRLKSEMNSAGDVKCWLFIYFTNLLVFKCIVWENTILVFLWQNIRQSGYHLIFIMGIFIVVRLHFYFELAPSCLALDFFIPEYQVLAYWKYVFFLNLLKFLSNYGSWVCFFFIWRYVCTHLRMGHKVFCYQCGLLWIHAGCFMDYGVC